jgi:hypothetical protein
MPKTVTVALDFAKAANGAAEVPVTDITLADTIIATIAPVPADAPRLRLNLTHIGGFGAHHRELTLTDSKGVALFEAKGARGAQNYFSLRMCTKRGAREYNLLLTPGESYTVTTTGWLGGGARPDVRADCFFTLSL